MRATALLERHHREIETLFDELEAGRDDHATLLVRFADHLAAHMQVENALFYPAVRSLRRDAALRTSEEHAVTELVLTRLLAIDADDARFGARLATLRGLVEDHHDAEETELFPRADQAFGPTELEALGTLMKRSFDAGVAGGWRAILNVTATPTAADAAQQATFEGRPGGGPRPRHPPVHGTRGAP